MERLEELKIIRQKLMGCVLISLCGAIPLGLALYSLLGQNPSSLHPLLGNSTFAYLLLAVGVSTTIWCQIKMPPLLKRQEELKSAVNS